jgi:5-methyltetrahydropteroyltriglutamate--homocysteine methyltransferase
MASTPAFRAEHVGSLLRPQKLKDARVRLLGEDTPDTNIGPHGNADLATVEDSVVRELSDMQARVGLATATDGEVRRRSWWLELIMNWDGFSANRQDTSSPFAWRNESGPQQAFSTVYVTGRIKWRPSPIVEAFKYLKSATGAVPKVTIPAPPTVHLFMGGPSALDDTPYGDIDEFWDDLCAAYRAELSALAEAGATYIQIDDVTLPFICDPSYGEIFESWGTGADALLAEYAKRINDTLSVLPDNVTIGMHQCRGNREGFWAAEGGYDPVADVLFNQINADFYHLEYDTPRAGSFEPLRLVPDGKIAGLGLVSTKTPVLETADELKRRIDEAAKHAPLERLALTTQCGFASSVKGNPLSEADEEAKLARIVEVATDVWGHA